MKIILVIILIGLILIVGIGFYFIQKQHISISKEYQGPVRPTDDESYFRLTGITKPLGVNG